MSWRDRLQPASFRAVRFLVDEHEEGGGRRIDLRQYPKRDNPSSEDLGREADTFRIRAYVIADLTTQDYIPARDALRKACRAFGPANLVHPYLGTVSVYCRHISMRETQAEGGMASFDLEFVEAGDSPSPSVRTNTASSLFAGLQSILTRLTQAYAIGTLIAERPGVLIGLAEGYLGGLVTQFTGLPASVVSQIGFALNNVLASLTNGIAPTTSTITGLTADPVTNAISDAFAAAVAAVTAPAPVTPADPVVGLTLSVPRMPTDPTQGLAAFAGFGSTLAAPSGLQVGLQLGLQQQITSLVTGLAVAAVAQIYAGTQWTSSAAASAAREQLLDMLNDQVLDAAANDQDALYQGWLAITGLATADLIQRAQGLPNLASYTMPASLPAAALAQLFYQDGTQAEALVSLNDAVHPSFMPVSGVYLS